MTCHKTRDARKASRFEDVGERMCQLAAEQMDLTREQVALRSDLQNDLGMDSLDKVEFLMAVEEEYGLELADERAETIATIGDAVAVVAAALQQAPDPRPAKSASAP